MEAGAEAAVDAKGSLAEGGGFACPRCSDQVELEFYGPCEKCRDILRATITAEARDVDSGSYEPKMNVTPNAVATKD